MFNKIQDELAKMIAKEIFNIIKKQIKDGEEKARDVLNALKETTLKTNGAGLPPGILVAFQNSFLSELSARMYRVDGYTCWSYRNQEQKFNLLLREPLVARIQQTNWVDAASKTKAGVDQINAVGGQQEYQALMSSAIGTLFDYTASKYIGVFHIKSTSTIKGLEKGWRLLSGVIHASAAPEGTTQFKGTAFLYYSYGNEEDTANEYKLSKKLLTTGILRKDAPPSRGPYITSKSSS